MGMSNPFTQFLRQWSNDDQFAEFVQYWDRLEAVVVGVYRKKMSLKAAENEFTFVWPWLRLHYPAWERLLRPYWQSTLIAGKPTQHDPFVQLLQIEVAEDIY